MHHKFALIDEELLITGSCNWSTSATNGNYENLLVTRDLSVVKAYKTEFLYLWEQFYEKNSKEHEKGRTKFM